jgi:xylulokinase
LTPVHAVTAPLHVGVDVGTGTIRAFAFDSRGRTIASAIRPSPFSMLLKSDGFVDAEQIWHDVRVVLTQVAAGLPRASKVAGIAVASVGESCVLVGENGFAVAPVLAWFDRRTNQVVDEVANSIGSDRIFRICGLTIDPTLGLCKLVWMRKTWPEAFAKTVTILNIADWVAFRLSGEVATDFSLASRTMILDVSNSCWSKEIAELSGFDLNLFAPLKSSATNLGPLRKDVAASIGFEGPITIAVGAHDHLSGSLAAGLTRPGILLDSMGTAELLLLATPAPIFDHEVIRRGYVQGRMAFDQHWCYIGAGLNSSGGAIDWFRSTFANSAQTAHGDLIARARSVPPGAHGACFAPYLGFSPPPHPDPKARGAFIGLTTQTDEKALYRALLEGLAMESRLMAEGIATLPNANEATEIRAIGGNSKNHLLVEIKASVFNRPITVIDQAEASALGAALLAGIAAGSYRDLDEALSNLDRSVHTIEPNAEWTRRYENLYNSVYRRMYDALRDTNHAIAAETWSGGERDDAGRPGATQ